MISFSKQARLLRLLLSATTLFQVVILSAADASADKDAAWGGLVPQPKKLEGVGRWQIAYRNPRGRIYSIAWSPDGKRIAFSESSNLRICNASDFALVNILPGHRGRVLAIDWNHKTDRIASASEDGTVRMWSGDGKPLAVLRGHERGVHCVGWSADGTRLASGDAGGKLLVRDGVGRTLQTIDASDTVLNCVSWSPDGTQFVTGDDAHQVKLWTADGSKSVSCEGHLGKINAIAWRPDGSRFATSTWGYKAEDTGNYVVDVRIWNRDGSPVGNANGDTPNYGMQWAPDGNSLVAINERGTLSKISADGIAQSSEQIEGVGGMVSEPSLAFSPSGEEIAIGDVADIRIVNARQPTIGRTNIAGSLVSINPKTTIEQASGDAQRVLTRSRSTSEPVARTLWNLAEGKRFELPDMAQGPVSLSPNDDRVAVVQNQTTLAVWKAGEQEAPIITRGEMAINAVSWSPAGDRIAFTSDLNAVRIVKADGAKLAEIKLDVPAGQQANAGIRGLEWGADGKALIASTPSQQFIISAEGKLICTYAANTGATIWHDPDFTRIAAQAAEGGYRMWKRGVEQPITIPDLPTDVEIASFSPDFSWMIFGRDSGDWELRKTDDPGTIVRTVAGHSNGSVISCGISKDGKQFATGGWDADVKLWSAEGELERTFSQHSDPVYRVIFSDDGKRLISWTRVHTLMRYTIDDGPDAVLVNLDAGGHMLVRRDGTLVVRNTDDAARQFIILVEQPDGRAEIVDTKGFLERHKLVTP